MAAANSTHTLLRAWDALKSRPPIFFTDNTSQLQTMKHAISSAIEQQQRELEVAQAEADQARASEQHAVNKQREAEFSLEQLTVQFDDMKREFDAHRQSSAQGLLEAETGRRREVLEVEQRWTLAIQDADNQISKLTARTVDLEDRLRSTSRSKLYAEDVLERTKQAHTSEMEVVEARMSDLEIRAAEVEHLRTLLASEEQACRQSTSRASLLENRLQSADAQIQGLVREMSLLKGDLSTERQQTAAAQWQSSQYRAQMEEALTEARKTASHLKQVSSQNQSLAEEVQSSIKDRNMAEQLLDGVTHQLETTKHEAEAARHQVGSANERRAAAEIELCKLQDQAQARLQELVDALETANRNGADCDDWRKRFLAEEAARELGLVTVAQYEGEVATLQASLRQSLVNSRDLQTQCSALEEAKHGWNTRTLQLEDEVQTKAGLCKELETQLRKAEASASESEATTHELTQQLAQREAAYAELLAEKASSESRLGEQAAALSRQLAVDQVERAQSEMELKNFALENSQGLGTHFTPYLSDSLDGAIKQYKESFIAVKSGETVSYSMRDGTVDTRRYGLGSEVASQSLENWKQKRTETSQLAQELMEEVLAVKTLYVRN
eukprot:TRINITY_DN13433_c0_g1_i2.p1 TRINITY_DN13433_c0_g1~~TRINITY_DN13433_c0_g1_i2.p1  ORF type:complete len:614 (+),score=244.38 TRINITY_DN13433_c0_g1_i2:189-2030(+)